MILQIQQCCTRRCSGFASSLCILQSLILLSTTNAFVNRHQFGMPRTSINYRTTTENDVQLLDSTASATSTAAPLAVDTFFWEEERNGHSRRHNNGQQKPPNVPISQLAQRLTEVDHDPSLVEFVPSEDYHDPEVKLADVPLKQQSPTNHADDEYPLAAMLQGSAPYIASHLGETVVFYIPGEWLHKPNKLFDSFLQDVALSRLMGMKIVLVADCRMEADDSCQDYEFAHECHNSLRVTPSHSIRQIEEEAGYIRFEVERKLNRFLRMHLAGDSQEGNVIGGNFYQARSFGTVQGEDYQHTGFVNRVYTDNIRHSLNNNDVVLLTTVGCSPHGDSVNVNGHHLAAAVAASLNAYKLIYMSNQGSVMSSSDDHKFFQEVPLSFAQDLCNYHKVKVHHKTGFANFEHARQRLEPRAVELLLNLAWASWAIDQGVTRAHIVNPKDGALLEELFTSKNGANTCLYHDDENLHANDDDDAPWLMSQEDADDWNAFFAEAQQAQQEAAAVRERKSEQ